MMLTEKIMRSVVLTGGSAALELPARFTVKRNLDQCLSKGLRNQSLCGSRSCRDGVWHFCSRHSKSGLCIHRSDDGGCSYSAGAFEHFFCTKNMESASYGTRRRKIFIIIQWAESEKSALPIHNDLLILSRFFKFTQNLKRSHQVPCLHKDCHRSIACRLDCAALLRIRILRRA